MVEILPASYREAGVRNLKKHLGEDLPEGGAQAGEAGRGYARQGCGAHLSGQPCQPGSPSCLRCSPVTLNAAVAEAKSKVWLAEMSCLLLSRGLSD